MLATDRPHHFLSDRRRFWTVYQRDHDQQQEQDEKRNGVCGVPGSGRATKRERMIRARDKVKDTQRERDNRNDNRAIEKQWIFHGGY